MWVARADFLAALGREPDPYAVGLRVWERCEPWVRSARAAASNAGVLLAECRQWLHLLDRHSDLELRPVGADSRISCRLLLVEPDARECELRRGALAGLLAERRGAPPRVRHDECAARGDAACVYLVEALVPSPDPAHAAFFADASLLASSLQGREAYFRELARRGAARAPFPDVRDVSPVRRFMEDIEDIILVFDRNLRIVDANRAAVAFSGMTLDELRGLTPQDLLSEDSMKDVVRSVPLLMEQGFRRGLRVEGRTRTGWVPLELSARVSENRETVVCIARDISEHLRMERELAERNRQLLAQNDRIREANLLKSEFLANVSHELNTPLTSIGGFTKLLRKDLMKERAEGEGRISLDQRIDFLGILANETDRMRDLISGLLELSKIESGAVTLDRALTSLNAIVEDSLMVLKPRLDERELSVRARLAPGLPRALLDPARMKQVALNLIDNAIKFSPPGCSVELQTSHVRGMIELSLRNPAPAVEESDLERMFGRFFQRDGSFRRPHGGVGLGLNLVRAIAELHGGKAWAELPEPGWIAFRVRVPAGVEASRI